MFFEISEQNELICKIDDTDLAENGINSFSEMLYDMDKFEEFSSYCLEEGQNETGWIPSKKGMSAEFDQDEWGNYRIIFSNEDVTEDFDQHQDEAIEKWIEQIHKAKENNNNNKKLKGIGKTRNIHNVMRYISCINDPNLSQRLHVSKRKGMYIITLFQASIEECIKMSEIFESSYSI